jgi:hypothetical protein
MRIADVAHVVAVIRDILLIFFMVGALWLGMNLLARVQQAANTPDQPCLTAPAYTEGCGE